MRSINVLLGVAVKVFELDGGAGVVVFRQVNGKMVSRFYRAQA